MSLGRGASGKATRRGPPPRQVARRDALPLPVSVGEREQVPFLRASAAGIVLRGGDVSEVEAEDETQGHLQRGASFQ